MTDRMYDNPGQVANRLGFLAQQFGKLSSEWAKAAAEFERVNGRYKLELAKALIQQEGGSEADRKARAEVEVADLHNELTELKGKVAGCVAFYKAASDEGGLLQSLLRKETEDIRYTQFTGGQQ